MNTEDEQQLYTSPDRDEPIKSGDVKSENEEETKEENTGMDMGTDYKEDQEQDMDDLVHSKATLHKKSDIPPPEES